MKIKYQTVKTMQTHIREIRTILEIMDSDLGDDILFEKLVVPLEKEVVKLDNQLFDALCNAEINIDEQS